MGFAAPPPLYLFSCLLTFLMMLPPRTALVPALRNRLGGHRSLFRRLRVRLAVAAVLLAGLAAPSALAQSSVPTTGEVVSYDIELQEGSNLVSLPVLPDTSAMELVVADILQALTLVQDDMGRYFMPTQDITDLDTWSWEDAYSVKVPAPTTLTVEGVEILPESSPVQLEAGVGNWVPYFQNRSLSVSDAFASIAEHLSRVEDDQNRFYEPADESSTLDSLQVGRGYRVWVDQATTLIYPSNTSQSGGDGGDGGDGTPIGTLAQALSLPGLEVGQEIEILGYYTPGDGGGGTFRVEASGATPDGGLVFVPDVAVSEPIVEVLPNDQTARYLNLLPGGENVVYGSLTVDLLEPGSEESLLTIEGRHLHGVEWTSQYANNMTFDYATGELHDRRRRLMNHCGYLTGGDGWSCDLQFTYRHTTSPLRLHRLNVGHTLNADWFGARTVEEDPAFDNQPVLNHVINVADAMNAEAPGTITTIYLPELAVYEYFGSIRLADGLTLKGAGGTELVTVTNDLGHTYSPVRLKSAHTTLRVKSNEALTHIRMKKDPDDPFYLEPDVKEVLHTRQTAIYIQPGAMSAGLEDLFLDGNWEGNQQAWTEEWATFEERETWMRNTPGWSGFISTNHNGVDIPQGQQITLRNVAILGYAATGVLGNVDNTWIAENVRLGNALWNHSMYATNGTWTNLTFEGFAWTFAAWYAGEINNLVFEDGAHAPYRPGPDMLNIRGGDVSSQEDAGGLGGSFIQEDGTPLQLGTTIDGFYLDLRGSDINQPFNGLGPNITIKNGVVVTGEEDFSSVFQENGNGYQDALYPDYLIENVVVYDNTVLNNSSVFGALNTTRGLFRNVTKTPDLFETENSANAALSLRANWRNNYAWNTPQVNVFDGIAHDSPHKFIASVSIHNNAAGVDYFILNSRFNNTTTTLYQNGNGQGTLEGLNGAPGKLRVYMENVDLKIGGSYLQNLETFFALTYFSEVTNTLNGQTSEDGGTYVSTGSDRGRNYVIIPTDLLWKPHAEDGTVSVVANAGGIVSGTTFTNAEGNPLGPDKRGPYLRVNLSRPIGASETISFTWEAAVRPWLEGVTVPDYAQ